MKPVTRDEILDYQTYSECRGEIYAQVAQVKANRRILLGEHLLFLFENRDTVRYQVQEMMRIEKIVKEADILHEIETYNELLGGPGELGCTLLIQIDDPEQRDRFLKQWLPLPRHLYLVLEDGTKVYAHFDARQLGDTRLSSVQFLKFDTRGRTPVAVGTDFQALAGETKLTRAQREALAADLRDTD